MYVATALATPGCTDRSWSLEINDHGPIKINDHGPVESPPGTRITRLASVRAALPHRTHTRPPAHKECPTMATYTKTAIQLNRGDIVVAPDGTYHRVTEWTSFPQMMVSFRTDTGLNIDVPWIDATTIRGYDVLT